MKIGNLTLETVEPNEALLLSSTGLSAAEMAQMLARPTSPSLLARALNACLAEPMPHAELARAVASDPGALVAIGELYGIPRKEPKRGRRK